MSSHSLSPHDVRGDRVVVDKQPTPRDDNGPVMPSPRPPEAVILLQSQPDVEPPGGAVGGATQYAVEPPEPVTLDHIQPVTEQPEAVTSGQIQPTIRQPEPVTQEQIQLAIDSAGSVILKQIQSQSASAESDRRRSAWQRIKGGTERKRSHMLQRQLLLRQIQRPVDPAAPPSPGQRLLLKIQEPKTQQDPEPSVSFHIPPEIDLPLHRPLGKIQPPIFGGWQSSSLELIPGCPAGMERLARLDRIIVKQDTQFWGGQFSINADSADLYENTFGIFDATDEQIFLAAEDHVPFRKRWIGEDRGFTIHINDNARKEVFRVIRNFGMCKGLSVCPLECARLVAVCEDSSGQTLGYISDTHFFVNPVWEIYDDNKDTIAQIAGRCCPGWNCSEENVEVRVTNMTADIELGIIDYTDIGCYHKICSDEDEFSLSFSKQLDVKKKALLTATLLVMILEMNAGLATPL